MAARIIPSGAEIAHQVLLTVAAGVAVFVILRTFPGLHAWINDQRDSA